jgi:flagellar biosynthetic protein FlhB
MVDGDVMSEKTEKATPWKLQKAKEHGQVSKSTELISCVLMLISLGVAIALGPSILTQLRHLILNLFYLTAHVQFSIDTMNHLQQFVWLKLIALWLPFALAGMLAIILATVAQTGFVWSAKPLTPDFSRLDLAKGCKRLFSSKILFDAGKNSLKLVLACMLLYASLSHELITLLKLINTSPSRFPFLWSHLLSKITLQLLAMLFALALVDKLYTRWKYEKDNRMSKQEVKDEYRQREGDPKIKLKIKQLQHQLRQKTASLEQVKTADVVITDPTHLAIALSYKRGDMPAPKVICKAQGEMVKQIEELAARHRVRVIKNIPLTQLLFATSNLNQYVHRDHFAKVAAIFRELYRQKAAS